MSWIAISISSSDLHLRLFRVEQCYGVSFVWTIETQYPDLDTILQRIYRRIVSLSSKNSTFTYVVI